MSVLKQTLQVPLSASNVWRNIVGHQRWRWVAWLVLLVALVASGRWAWLRFVNTGDLVDQTTPIVVNATNNGASESRVTIMPAQSRPVVEEAPRQAPVQQRTSVPVAAMAITTTQSTAPLVVLAGTDGAPLLTTPGGEEILAVGTGALLNATGRNVENTWLYVSTVDGVAGWVATSQIIGFGMNKLPVVTVTAPQPADTAESAAVTTTVESSITPEITKTAELTATESATVTVSENDTLAAAPSADSTTGVTATVIVNGVRLNIRSGPGTRYAIVGKARRNEEVTVLARNEAVDWVQIALPDREDALGWVAASYLRLTGAIADLPVSAAQSEAPVLAVATVTAANDVTTVATTDTVVVATQPTTVANGAQPSTTAVKATPATGLSGTLVFQSSPGGMIYGYHLSSGRLWPLTNGFDPAISPDGQTVAFVRTAGENGLYLIAIDGSNERLIFSGRNTLAAPKWSPDGNYIVFARGDEYKECRNLGRGGCLTDKELLDQNPNFPVDNFPLIKDYESNLARVDTNGGSYRDLATLESARVADWNEAGIVYQSSAGLQITADQPDATNQLVIHDPYKPAYEDPDWQPNGDKIIFVSRGGNHREIYSVNPNGSGMVALTKPVTTLVDELPNNVAPAWSPDGQSIVFLSNRSADNSAGAWKLWVMNADGSNQHPLPIGVAINYTYGNEQVVSWGR